MGDLQTVFYLVLVGGIILALGLFFLGVGFTQLPGLFHQSGHRLLAGLITGAFAVALLFIVAVGGALVYGVGHRG